MSASKQIATLKEQGYSIVNQAYSQTEINRIVDLIEKAQPTNESFRSSKDLFAIRQVLRNIPELEEVIYNPKIIELLDSFFQGQYFLTKSIYFDKPSDSNWFVAFHQDLSITVNSKAEVLGYSNWTSKSGQIGVQPPIEVLNSILTIRIHLDQTTKDNGALKVVPASNRNGITRVANLDWNKKTVEVCEVEKGGVMLMQPLTLHASSRTTNNQRRRVLHLEFSNKELQEPLKWEERKLVKKACV